MPSWPRRWDGRRGEGHRPCPGTYQGRDATDGTFQIALLEAVEIVPDTVLVVASASAIAQGMTYDEQVIQQHLLRDGRSSPAAPSPRAATSGTG